jgi:hypothetical protein
VASETARVAIDHLRTRVQAASPRWIRAVRMPAVWEVYAALVIAVSAFLAIVLLMAFGVVATPHA